MIPVTKPFFPPIEDYQALLKGIWQREWLTNHGPLVIELEQKLKEYLKVPNLLFLTNGTIALQIAIKALGLSGEIITTPYSYVATTSSIVWEGCTPVFVDIDPQSFNIDPNLIEKAITPATSAILATHVYGNPCDVEAIENIAKKFNLKIIYDAAHAFGVTVNGKSIFEYGDISTTSFHATKLFHTAEGGAVFSGNHDLYGKMALLRNFGHKTAESFNGIGINGKNSELHAAMGLCNLAYLDKIFLKRKEQSITYDKLLASSNGLTQSIHNNAVYNYAYYPYLFESEEQLIQKLELFRTHNIFPRRYFFPSLSKLEYVGKQECPVSENIASRAICLPLYHSLLADDQQLIANILLKD